MNACPVTSWSSSIESALTIETLLEVMIVYKPFHRILLDEMSGSILTTVLHTPFICSNLENSS